jgi:murein DD-endopeptidase MepM/ murein hydrolase activator NlpD
MKRLIAVLPASLLLTVMNTAAPEVPGRSGPRVQYNELVPRSPATLPAHSIVLTIEDGDTLESILLDGGIDRVAAGSLIREAGRSFDLRRLKPGDLVRFHLQPDGSVDSVEIKIVGWGELHAVRGDNGFAVTTEPAVIREVDATISARIDSSLYEALMTAGEGPQLAQQIVDIFQWDIDFFALQRGDSFSLVVHKRFSGSDPMGYGPVVAARFNHGGQTFEAFRQEMRDGRAGYYTRKGLPLRKQFLRAPLQFTRITSKFSKSRWHPILQCFRPHHGVDYGAPVGTPVMTTADGVVVEAGRKGGEGNFIRVRHTMRIDTYYLHLSKFARGIKRGARVTQGQVIGYVGSTGLATGPHLDYRVNENGVWLDPLKLKSISPDPLPVALTAEFHRNVLNLSPKLAAVGPQVAEFAPRRRALF